MWFIVGICLALMVAMTMAVIFDFKSGRVLALQNQKESENLLRAAKEDPEVSDEDYQKLRSALEDINTLG